MTLGISSYTFNWWTGNVPGHAAPADRLTPEGLLDLAAKHDVRVVQIADNMPLHELMAARLEALAARGRDLDCEIEIGTLGVQPDHLRQYIEIARRLDARLLRTLIDVPMEEAAPLLRQIVPDLEKAGVRLAIENHDRFRAAELRHIVEETASHVVGICLDTANSLGCGEGIETVLAELGRYTVNLHVKDFAVRRLPHGKGFVVTGTPAGKGLLDIPRVLAGVPRDINCILELWSEPLESVEASIERENHWAAESLEYLRPLVDRCG
jgi:sugar phosphate isomerase/epimerase